jgi:Outer membrane protein beta-barrel family/Carboxypeptidase regulatory-like domain
MKNSLLAIALLFSVNLTAQNFTIKGKAVDENNAPLPGAHVALQYPWGEDVKLEATEANGRFTFTQVEQGGYKIQITYLGYEHFVKEVTVSGQPVDLGALQLTPATTNLTEVEVKDQVPMAKVNGDTIEFNAGAFKVMSDASAEDLVAKMPTVTIEGGKLQAQGEDVKEVLVDGRPFFGNDPTAALRNLPAEVIEKVQVFDQESDQAQFSGFSDGNTAKTINIVTKKNMRAGQFGKIYAGYGTGERYQSGGNLNFFDGDRRISVIGMSNNVNVQNFSSEDLLGVMGSGGRGWGGGRGRGRGRGGSRGGGSAGDFLVQSSGGIATTSAIGINYSDQWGKKTEISGSYFFNRSRNNATELVNRQFMDAEGLGELYDEESTTISTNANHRANFRIEYDIDSLNSLIFRPRLTLQLNDGNSGTLGQTTFGTGLLNSTDNTYFSNLTALDFNSSMLWRHKFAKPRRTFSVNVSPGYSPKNGDNTLQSYDAFFRGVSTFDTLDQRSGLDVNSWNISSKFTYTEPIGERGQIEASYRASWQQEESDKSTYDFSETTGGYDDLNEQLSNVFSNDYYTQTVSTGYGYNKGRELNLMVRASYQWAKLLNDQTYPDQREFDHVWNSILPFAMLRYNINRQKNIRIFYRTSTRQPSVEQLQNVVDNTNPLQLSTGNPDLAQSYQHNIFLRYQSTNTEKSTVFYAMIRASLTNDNISNATYFSRSDNPIFDDLDVQPGAQITLPVNLNGYRNLRAFSTYGLPLKKLKSNLNFNLSWTYVRTPGLLDDELNYSNSNTASIGATLNSNISDQIDFTLSSRSNLSRATNSLQTQGNSDYLIQNSRLRLNWIIYEGFVLRTDLNHQLYTGLSDDFNQNYWLWNFGIGKKLFKNERGELTLSVNDLLNQNRSISRSVTESYIEDTWTNNLQQYFMLTFTYDLRNFNSGKQSSRQQGGDSDRMRGGRPPWMH